MIRVEWSQSALDELTRIWTQADSATRQAITTASHKNEQRLQRNPHSEGESRSGDRRFAFEPPLAVIFRAETDGQTVTVNQVRVFRRRS
jgi:plasmid stabilization system protein ParE